MAHAAAQWPTVSPIFTRTWRNTGPTFYLALSLNNSGFCGPVRKHWKRFRPLRGNRDDDDPTAVRNPRGAPLEDRWKCAWKSDWNGRRVRLGERIDVGT